MFVIENNLYGEYSPLRTTTPIDDLADRAKAHGHARVIVDGQDIDAVHEVASEAVERARRGEGPTLIEAKTYRYRGHSRTDPASTARAGELDAWKERDPIDAAGRDAGRRGACSPPMQRKATARGDAEQIDAAAERAAQTPGRHARGDRGAMSTQTEVRPAESGSTLLR